MSDGDRNAFLLDKLRLEKKPAASRMPRKTIIGIAAVVALLVGSTSFVLLYPESAIPVQEVIARATSSTSDSLLDASGYVIARRQATLSAKILGKLVGVPVEEGEHVSQGQVVARLDDSNYLAALQESQAQAEVAEAVLDQAKIAYDDAVPNYRRYRLLFTQGAISAEALDGQKSLYDAAKTAWGVAVSNLAAAKAAVAVAQTNEDDTVVRAPFPGIVTDKAAQPGEIVAPAAAGGGFTRTGIATVVDMGSLEVQVDVNENYIDRVRPGQKATVRLNAYSSWEIPASVIAIIPTADETKGSVKVRIGVQTKDRRILPQMGARVSFMASPSAEAPAVVVPLSAVKRGKTGASVFVIRNNSSVSEREVRIGSVRGGSATITSGLVSGERIAIGDFGKLKDNSRVEVARANKE